MDNSELSLYLGKDQFNHFLHRSSEHIIYKYMGSLDSIPNAFSHRVLGFGFEVLEDPLGAIINTAGYTKELVEVG